MNRVIILALLLAFLSIAQESSSMLADSEWLAANMDQEKLTIVDMRENIGDYWQGHIPGAVYLSPDALRWPEGGVPAKLIPPKALATLLGEMGIDSKTTVVVYSEKGDYKAPYLVWALDYIGHPESAVLDGGFGKWKAEGRPQSQDFPEVKPRQYRLPRKLNKNVRATLEEVEEIVAGGGAVLLDVRPLSLYTGEQGPWKRKGHIKGAAQHFWGEDLWPEGTWRSEEELTKAYESLGVTLEQTVVVYCGQGLMSAHAYFTIGHILGSEKVKNYDGGFNEWSSFERLPIETGIAVSSALEPSSDAQKLVRERCTVCHTLSRVDKARKDKGGWEKTVARMIKKGAELSEAERKVVIDHLSQTRGEK